MKIKWHPLLAIVCLWLMAAVPVLAQTPRPTPTNVATNQSDPRGSVFGNVYLDVNGDGNCVNSGVEGEQPVANVNIQLTSSNATTVIPLTTGSDGSFGLVAAGESNWEVLVVTDATMVVTSQNPIYVPVYADGTLDHSNINFCIASSSNQAVTAVVGGSANAVIVANSSTSAGTETNALILNPDSGAAKQSSSQPIWLIVIAGIGAAFFLAGLGIEWRRRKAS